MKRVIFKVIALSALLLVTGLYYQNAHLKAAETIAMNDSVILREAFESTGARFRKIDLQGWAQLKEDYSSEDQMLKAMEKVIAIFGINQNEIKTEKSTRSNLVSVTQSGRLDPDTYLTVIMQTTKDSGRQNKPKSYLIVGISHFRTPANYKNLRIKMVEVFSLIGEQAHYSNIISGYVAKKMEVKEMQKMSKKVMQITGAEEVENYADDRMTSVTGFTPAISDRLTLGPKRVNINMAARYNSTDAGTYIYIGSPIITTEY